MSWELSAIECHVNQLQVPCRVCSQLGLNPVLSHDEEPVVRESAWPIELAWCPTCSLVQWTEAAPNGGQFDHAPSMGRGKNEEIPALADRLVETRQLGIDSLVVEIAGGDTGLLPWYHQAGIPVVAIGPARNRSTATESRPGMRMISEPFGHELALELVRANSRADVIHANDAFAHVEDLNGVVSGLATLLKPDGIAVVEVPYLRDLAEHVGFNTLGCDELCYFSLTSLTQLFGQHGLEIVDAERLKTHGGTLRITAARFGTTSVTPAVHDLMDDESAWVRDPAFYQSFGETLVQPSRDRWAA